MPNQDSHSPSRRFQLAERTPSTQSLSRASPSTGKGSSHKLHKAHAVGHGRHSHGRVASYGKNLNKLSKLTPAQPTDEVKTARNSKSQDFSMSPSASSVKRTGSNVSLPRTGSKVSMKRNSSNLSQKRNKSSSKLGNPVKSERVAFERDGHLKGYSKKAANFSIGSDDQEEGWTETSSSPSATRPNSMARKQTSPAELPTPDQPPIRSPTNLPDSPPQSPLPEDTKDFSRQPFQARRSSPPNPEAVTRRLLSRHGSHNAKPQVSSISAAMTPGSNGSPPFKYSQDATLGNDQSLPSKMPSEAKNRLLLGAGSSSDPRATGSVSRLQSALADIHHQHENRSSPSSPPAASRINTARRARSAANLSTPNNPSRSLSPPVNALNLQVGNRHRASPFAASREHQSLTQLKLNLQRISSSRDPAQAPAIPPPPLASAHPSFADLEPGSVEQEADERRQKQRELADIEYYNVRRYGKIVLNSLSRLEKRGIIKVERHEPPELERGQNDEQEAISTSADGRPGSSGRIGFEVGFGGDDKGAYSDEGDDDDDDDDFEALLRRMWEADEAPSEGDD